MARKTTTTATTTETTPSTATTAKTTPATEAGVMKTVEPVIAKKPRQPEVEEPTTERYRLKAVMNVRKKPILDSTILRVEAEGTVVRVLKVEGDWLCLSDGSFILYEGGKWAEKI